MSSLNKVKGFRTMLGKTQEQMAEILGVHVNTYRALENNPKDFKLDQMQKFVKEVQKVDSTITLEQIFS